MNGTELRSFSHFEILSNFECKFDLQVFSWRMEQNWEVLVILKFWPESYALTLTEILKIDKFWSLSSFTAKLWKSLKMIKF